MTFAELRAAVAEIQVKGLAYPVSLTTARAADGSGYEIHVELLGLTSVNPPFGPTALYGVTYIAPELLAAEGPHLVAYWVRKRLQAVVMHELDECIYVSGVRAFDPHAGETSP